MKTGIELIAEERKEHFEKHNRTIEHDVKFNKQRQLIEATLELIEVDTDDLLAWFTPEKWDEKIFEKMIKKPYKERLIIAGALIAAEIDRIQAENQ